MEVHFIMSKYSISDKLSAIDRVLSGKMSCNSSAKILGTTRSVVQLWIKKYEKYGKKGLFMKQGTYSGIFKKNVVEYMYQNRLSALETALRFGIPSDATVGIWERIYSEKGVGDLMKENRGRKGKKIKNINIKPEQTDTDKLLAEIERLRMENEFLKKLQALVQKRINPKNKK